MLGALAFVVTLFLGGLWLFRHSQRLALRHGRSAKLSVIETKSLGQRHTLYLVRCEEQRLLLAASPGGVTMLTMLPGDRRDEETATQAAPAAPWREFPGLLVQALARRS
jgi:flagellar biogenesis protein FliO